MKKLGLVVLVIGLVAASAIGLSACGSSGGKEGGTLTGSYASFPDFLDPQLSYTREGWTAMYDTYLPLLTYKRANGEEGSEVAPGLAEDMPKISSDGKTYELTLRKGLKYSDGTPVKASDFRKPMERLFKIDSPGFSYYESIVGAEKFAETKTGGIPGIKTDDKTGAITIELTAPRGTFTNELGLLFAAVLPAGTPARNLTADPPPGDRPLRDHQVRAGSRLELRAQPLLGQSQLADRDGRRGQLRQGRDDGRAQRRDPGQRDRTRKTMWMQPPPPADRASGSSTNTKGPSSGSSTRSTPTSSG